MDTGGDEFPAFLLDWQGREYQLASYDKSVNSAYTTQVQNVLKSLGANLGSAGVDGKWGAYTQAAYDQYKDQVDAALAGGGAGGSGSYGGGFSFSSGGGNYSAPTINYSGRTLDEMLAEANGLIGGEYDTQLRTAKQGYEANQQSLSKAYENTRKTTQDSAVSRGMGRSSYLTDAIANVGLQETAANDTLTKNYNDAVDQLELSRSKAVSSYVQQLQREQDNRLLELALAQAELQYKYDALNASMMSGYGGGYSTGGSSGGSSGKSSSSSKKKTSTSDALVAALKSQAQQNIAAQVKGRGTLQGLAAPTKGKNYNMKY